MIINSNKMFIVNFFGVEIFCDDPTTNVSQLNMIFKDGSPPFNSEYLKIISVSCDTGNKFTDNSNIQIMNCTGNPGWTYPTVSCNRIFYTLNFYIKVFELLCN